MTRSSTPKYEVYHTVSGEAAVTGISKTQARAIACEMNKGSEIKRIAVRRVLNLDCMARDLANWEI